MRFFLYVFGIFGAATIAAIYPNVSTASCTLEERRELRAEGLTADEIKEQCGSSSRTQRTPTTDWPDTQQQPNQSSAYSTPGAGQFPANSATTCYTMQGGCRLYGPGSPGMPCFCATPYGNFPGSMR